MDVERGGEPLSQQFEELTDWLVNLHRQAMAVTEAGGRVDPDVQTQVLTAMKLNFVDDPDVTKIFNYIMFLIAAISDKLQQEEEL